MTDTAKAAASVVAPAPSPPGDVRKARRTEKARLEGPFVKYVGDASDRIIRASDWRQLGIPLKDDKAQHVWSKKNDYIIPLTQFTDEQLDYLLIDDLQPKGGHSFLEVNWNADGKLEQVVD